MEYPNKFTSFMRTLVHSIFLYGSETWTITNYLEKRINSFENKCYRKLLNISYKDRVSNTELKNRISEVVKVEDSLINTIKKRKLRWYGHVTRSNGLSKTILQGSLPGQRKRGRPKKTWTDNIKEWTGLTHTQLQETAHNRPAWKNLVNSIHGVPTT